MASFGIDAVDRSKNKSEVEKRVRALWMKSRPELEKLHNVQYRSVACCGLFVP